MLVIPLWLVLATLLMFGFLCVIWTSKDVFNTFLKLLFAILTLTYFCVLFKIPLGG